jgi:hypothetical protein
MTEEGATAPSSVIPAKAGIQESRTRNPSLPLGPRFRGDDGLVFGARQAAASAARASSA